MHANWLGGLHPQWHDEQADQRPWAPEGDKDAGQSGHDGENLPDDAGAEVAQADCQGDLAGGGVGGNVAQVVRQVHGRRHRTDTNCAGQANPGQRAGLGELRAEHRYKTEEDEDRDLAKSAITVGIFTAGVEPRGRDAQRADQNEPPRAHQGQRHTGNTCDAKGAERRILHNLRLHQTRTRQAQRAGAVIVSAADAIGVVVGEVHTHNQRPRDNQREHRTSPDNWRVRRCRSDTDDDRRKRIRPGMGARAFQPIA